VLPLVPGYISMLSGVGMEQLRQGQQPRGGLFASALSFVLDFRPYSFRLAHRPSAVGSFLRENRTTLAPIAGALIILFGLHLLGVLIKLTFKIGIVLGSLLVALGIISLVWRDPLFFHLGVVHFFLAVGIGFFGPDACSLAESRCPFAQHIQAAGNLERLPARVCIRVRLDALHRADSRDSSRAGRRERDNFPRRAVAGGLFRGLAFRFC